MVQQYESDIMATIIRELAGIHPLLEVEDMLHYHKPDWKCVFTYVESFYRRWVHTERRIIR